MSRLSIEAHHSLKFILHSPLRSDLYLIVRGIYVFYELQREFFCCRFQFLNSAFFCFGITVFREEEEKKKVFYFWARQVVDSNELSSFLGRNASFHQLSRWIEDTAEFQWKASLLFKSIQEIWYLRENKSIILAYATFFYIPTLISISFYIR